MADDRQAHFSNRKRGVVASHLLALLAAAGVLWLVPRGQPYGAPGFAAFELALAAPASVYTVTSLIDHPDANPGNNVCADGGGNCTLRAAIMEANAHPGPDLIILPADSMALDVTGADEDDAATGDLDIKGVLTISGTGSASSIIDATALSDRVLHVITGANVTIMGVSIRKGTSHRGGGLVNHGNLTLTGSVIENNHATSFAGGILNFGSLLLQNCAVTGNTTESDGAGLVNYAGILVLNQCVVRDNQSLNMGSGGAIYSTGQVTVTASDISHNFARDGGGIYVLIANLVVSDSVIENNDSVAGGGIYVSGDASVVQSIIRNNHAVYGGGVLVVFNLSLDHSTVISNSAEQGGGIYLCCSSLPSITATFSTISANVAISEGAGFYGGGQFVSARVFLANSTVRSNRAGTDGGGLYLSENPNAILINSTISSNRANDDGGGIHISGGSLNGYNLTIASNIASADGGVSGSGGGIRRISGTVNLRNSILASNVHVISNIATDDDCRGTLGQIRYSLLGTTAGCARGLSLFVISGQSPRLLSLKDNGGPTETHALRRDSPAIDAADPSGCTDNLSVNLTSDQRGAPRLIDGNGDGSAVCDMGAFEYVPPVLLPLISR